MPGSNRRALEKAKSLPADGLILDLEDAVSPDAKPEARKNVAEVLAEGKPYGKREVIVRINGLNTPWGMDDIAAVAAAGADGIAIPKVESADIVRQVQVAVRAAGGPEEMPIWCMMETPMGILRALEIAAASPFVAALVMGTSDLAKDLHCEHTFDREPFLTSFGLIVLAARACGVAALDGVHLDLADDAGFAESCAQGRRLGFDGKTLIHPQDHRGGQRRLRPGGGGCLEGPRGDRHVCRSRGPGGRAWWFSTASSSSNSTLITRGVWWRWRRRLRRSKPQPLLSTECIFYA